MKKEEMVALAEKFLDAWNTQVVENVLACYTPDLKYRDPNTRGTINDADSMGRYLRKLFEMWQMTWKLRELFPHEGGEGCGVLWHATFRKASGGKVVEADGMDLVLMRGGLIARNEVYFDRTVLTALVVP